MAEDSHRSTASFEFDLAFFTSRMRRLGRADSTIYQYSACVRRFFAHIGTQYRANLDPDRVRPEQVGWFIDHLIAFHRVTSASNHLRAIRVFFALLESEGVIESSPVGDIQAPGKKPVPAQVLAMSDLNALLRACRGIRFNDLRDMAMARVFVSTGARRTEVQNLAINPTDYSEGDVDLERGSVLITGIKGGTDRTCSIDPDTVHAIRRYLRARRSHRNNGRPNLWLTQKGGIAANGLSWALRRRAHLAGIRGFHLHHIRHTFAHEWLKAGGNEGDLMRVLGWRSREMVDYYSSSVADERAVSAARKHAMSLSL